MWGGFDFCIFYVVCQGLLNVVNAVFDILRLTLGDHLYMAVWEVADKACEGVTVGDAKGGKTKANALDAAGENYMFGDFFQPVIR